MTDLFGRMIRFALVGISGILVDFSVTWLFKENLKLNKFVANGIGFLTAVSTNYLLNRWWTFENTNPRVFNQFMIFLMVSLAGLGFNTLVVYYFHKIKKQPFYLSKAIAIGVVFCWNFVANYFFTFR